MPLYLYKCTNCQHEDYRQHAMGYTQGVVCSRCNSWMEKKPQKAAVNWNGNKPSDGGVTDLVRNMIADAPEQREHMAAKKELKQ